MTTVTPPPPPLPLPAAAAPLPPVTVPNPPAPLLALAVGTKLEAMLLAQDPQTGTAQVQTPLGSMTLQTPLSLPKGAALVFSVQAQLPQMQMQLLTVNGRPAPAVVAQPHGQAAPGASPATASGGGAAPAAASSGPGGMPFVSLSSGTTATATLLRPAQGLAQPEAQPQLQEGSHWPTLESAKTALSTARSRLESMMEMALGRPSAAPHPSGAPAEQADGRPQGQASTAGSAPQTAGQPRTVPLPAGTQVTVTLVNVQAPAGGAATPPPVPAQSGGVAPTVVQGQVLSGTVTGTTTTGQPIVQTPAGPLALNSRVPVPLGSSVTLEIRTPPLPPAAAPDAFPSPAGSAALVRDWPALAQAAQALQEANPALAHQVMKAFPRPDGQLAASMMFFVAALKGGDLKGWLGEAGVRGLDRLRPALAGRLKEDFAERGRRSEETTADGWKMVAIPLQNGPGLEQMTLMTRHHPEDEGAGESGGGGTRFVVDLNLSRTGRLQLDGLVFRKSKRLDLIVRTEGPLETEIRDGIRAIYRDALEVTGMQGGVTFQARPPNFVDPVAKSGPAGHGLVV